MRIPKGCSNWSGFVVLIGILFEAFSPISKSIKYGFIVFDRLVWASFHHDKGLRILLLQSYEIEHIIQSEPLHCLLAGVGPFHGFSWLDCSCVSANRSSAALS